MTPASFPTHVDYQPKYLLPCLISLSRSSWRKMKIQESTNYMFFVGWIHKIVSGINQPHSFKLEYTPVTFCEKSFWFFLCHNDISYQTFIFKWLNWQIKYKCFTEIYNPVTDYFFELLTVALQDGNYFYAFMVVSQAWKNSIKFISNTSKMCSCYIYTGK